MTFSTINTQRKLRGFPLYLAILVLLVGVATVMAHARLLRSNPEDKAKLEKPPQQVEFWFNELLDKGFNTVEVYPAEELNAPTHTNLANDNPELDAKDKTHLTATLRALSLMLIPEDVNYRNPEQRELFLSGLRLAAVETT